jgi:hypothetical protein
MRRVSLSPSFLLYPPSFILILCLIVVPVFPQSFSVSIAPSLHTQAFDGRLLVMLSTDSTAEPRFQISEGLKTQLVFGVDVLGWEKGQKRSLEGEWRIVNGQSESGNRLRTARKSTIDTRHSPISSEPGSAHGPAYGYPIRDLGRVPAGRYRVQALLHKYETFKRSDGHTVKLPMDRGEGQQWNRAPGNLLSKPAWIDFDPKAKEPVSLMLDTEIPPIPPPVDTKYIKHIRIRSEKLSKFWGRDFYLGANVLLPQGWDTHPDSRYPLMVFHGHFPYTFGGFRETPPDPDLKPDYSERFKIHGYNRIQQEYAYKFYQEWTGPDFPRFIIIEIQHANPYYDDSYAVNSQNLGPYGDAIMYELIPEVEKRFRGIGQGWARFTYGGSTGGWEALAVQVFYPDEFNGCFVACPDPVDFRAYTLVNIYQHSNAYYAESQWKKTPRPATRNWLGEVSAMLEEANHYELALGTKSRSGQQWDIWEAVYSPVGQDGYPVRIWDKVSGTINKEVAGYWRENYDLSYILQRDWTTLGPKLEGKIHVYCGDMDNYYLNNAVYLLEEFLKQTKNPFYNGEVDYGDRAEHCWNGDHNLPNALSRLRYNQMYVPKILARIAKSAPAGADITSWRY